MREPQRTGLEFVAVTVVGLLLAVAANAMSPRGLSLSRNYFPRLTTKPAATQPDSRPATSDMQQDATDPEAQILQAAIERIRGHGMQVISDEEAWAAYQDPDRLAGGIVFVDARKDDLYTGGHVPGAYQLYHYELERHIDEALPAVVAAQKVIVYCTGGDCDDSEFTGVELLKRGADQTRLFIYVGGMTEWKRHNRPVERGARDSGDIVGGAS